MNCPGRRLIVALGTAVAVVVPAALSMACVGIASLVIDGSPQVEPGGTVRVTARSFADGVPIDIRLGSLTGPVLVSVPGPNSTMNSSLTVDVPIPADIPDGTHVLLASQDHHDMNVGQPARAAIFVNAAPAAAPPTLERPVGLAGNTGPSALTLALIAAGVAAGGLLLAGLVRRVGARGGFA